MQTFLPYPDFYSSAACLDYRRLGKQRLEAKNILKILAGETSSKAWRNHPAVLMWRGGEDALREYYNACLAEWISRGYRNTMLPERLPAARPPKPWWFGLERFHAAHRANLLRKDPTYYGQFGWKEDPAMEYWWPVIRPEGSSPRA
ncbi:MAG: hypothetical protein HQK81_01365 [Desulfovibrionaceae bacterium]|nr:hypothetical protein [Desulfovibrionaceae bacterium]MBF0512698.1 hypothetical protein [Desulfovibrionaceae bacterium]